MSDLKTKRNKKSVRKFIESVEHEGRRADSNELLSLMEEVTGERPEMWGDGIVGFGSYRYKYASGREGDWFLTGFSPRKTSLSLYITCDLSRYEDLLGKLGRHKAGKGCLHINRLSDVDMKVLRRLVKDSVAHVRKREKA